MEIELRKKYSTDTSATAKHINLALAPVSDI